MAQRPINITITRIYDPNASNAEKKAEIDKILLKYQHELLKSDPKPPTPAA
ncbi:Hypothetical protein LUCI_0814 [Lucifera butyrica]|uniref:Uncharacterized protein n=1 Tax=Lucifera butyrica TaxID=1351585 RepID=A0A498R2A9_9FIRM|nr:hypothetical protein [Lucifera butyrica]VBB05604.1 Hypothetical protein LUCI_0814 [Lucifera butyrica]